jgi:hypothetical protein
VKTKFQVKTNKQSSCQDKDEIGFARMSACVIFGQARTSGARLYCVQVVDWWLQSFANRNFLRAVVLGVLRSVLGLWSCGSCT